MLRRLIGAATFAGLAAAVGLSVGWVVVADGPSLLEASAQMLGLSAAFTGILAERLAAERQRHRLALAALTAELLKNQAILDDLRRTLGTMSRRRVYPRLLASATDAVIASGVLATGTAQELFQRLHDWRNEVADFNRRLELTEMLTFLQGTEETIRECEQALGRDGGRLHLVAEQLQGLLDYLAQAHGRELHQQAAASRPHSLGSQVPTPLTMASPPPHPIARVVGV